MRTALRALAALNAVLVLAALPTTAGAVGVTDCLRTVDGIDLQTATIPQLEAAMNAGTLTAVDLVGAYLKRIEFFDRSNLAVNSIRTLAPDALDQAAQADAARAAGDTRPLLGIPVLLKDNVATKDMPTTADSVTLRGAQPTRDATITQKFRDAGAIILGKANLGEFANWTSVGNPNGWSSLAGRVKNAYTSTPAVIGDPSGSSSGSGVAASMAFAAATIGTETSGSILGPTDANGDAGVKTTMGLVSRYGILPLSPSFDVAGPITRNITDAAYVLDAIAGPDPNDSVTADSHPSDYVRALRRGALEGTHLAYSNNDYEGLSGTKKTLFDGAIARLRALGATVTGVDALTAHISGEAELGFIPNEFKASLNQYIAEWLPNAPNKNLDEIDAYAKAHPELYPYGTALLDASDATPGLAALYPAATSMQVAAKAQIEAALAEGGAEAIIAPGPGHYDIGAAAGYPTVETQMGYLNKRQPVDLAIMGRPYSEAKLLSYAYDYEQDAQVRVPPTDINSNLGTPSCG
jgi:amidase